MNIKKKLKLWFDDPNAVCLGSIYNDWQTITGNAAEPRSWLNKLRNRAKKWSTPFKVLTNLSIKDIARLQKRNKIGDVFMGLNDQEKRAVAKFLARKGTDNDTLETLFSPDILANPPLDQNEEPEPARERDFDLNQRLFDLNQNPPPELDEAGDDGGE